MIPDPGAFRESGKALYEVTLHRQQPLPVVKNNGQFTLFCLILYLWPDQGSVVQ